MLGTLANKSFMGHHTLGFQQPVLIMEWMTDEDELMKPIPVIR